VYARLRKKRAFSVIKYDGVDLKAEIIKEE